MTVESRTARVASVPPAIRGARAAFVFLTRLPVGGFPYDDRAFQWAPAYFPLVGATVGTLAGAVFLAASPLSAWIAALLAVATSALVTGAFHEDGLADTFDALGGAAAHHRDRLFEILKDSRIGTFGTVALFTVLGLRVACLAALATSSVAFGAVALVLSQAFARVGPVWLIATHDYVSPNPVAKSKGVSAAGVPQAVVATAWVLAFAAAAVTFELAPVGALVALALQPVLSMLLGVWFRRRAGGITGDFLGAAEQLGEVLALLTFVACPA